MQSQGNNGCKDVEMVGNWIEYLFNVGYLVLVVGYLIVKLICQVCYGKYCDCLIVCVWF